MGHSVVQSNEELLLSLPSARRLCPAWNLRIPSKKIVTKKHTSGESIFEFVYAG